VIGGPPCQSFSVSNVFQTDDDTRHSLPSAYARLLKALNERRGVSFFVFENVKGLLGRKHQHRYELFKEQFCDAGFQLREELLDAKDYGVPQHRPRIIIVGINRELHKNAIWKRPRKSPGATKTVREIIHELPEPVKYTRGLDPDTIEHDPKRNLHRNHWTFATKSRKFTTPGMLEEGQSWGRSFRTLAWDAPSWTVAYGNREVHIHPSGKRRLSIWEAMLLQSFPPNYILHGSLSAQSRLVSDAVPPKLAERIAKHIKRTLDLS
jgi:DNA (cytosine-5)-methyltransferase 1